MVTDGTALIISSSLVFIMQHYRRRPERINASSVQQVAPMRAIRLEKSGMEITIILVNSTCNIQRIFPFQRYFSGSN